MFSHEREQKQAHIKKLDEAIASVLEQIRDIELQRSDFIYQGTHGNEEKAELSIIKREEVLQSEWDKLAATANELEGALHTWENDIHHSVAQTLEVVLARTAQYLYQLQDELELLIKHYKYPLSSQLLAKEALPEPFKMPVKSRTQEVHINLQALTLDQSQLLAKDPAAKNFIYKLKHAITVYHALYVHIQSHKGRLMDVEKALAAVLEDPENLKRLSKRYEGPKHAWAHWFSVKPIATPSVEGKVWFEQVQMAQESISKAVEKSLIKNPSPSH